MNKMKLSFKTFVGIHVDKLKFPPVLNNNLVEKYKELLFPDPPDSTSFVQVTHIKRPYLYLCLSNTPQAQYIREIEQLPDLYPLEGIANNFNVSWIGLTLYEINQLDIEVDKTKNIISDILNKNNIEFNPEDIETVTQMQSMSIEPDEYHNEALVEIPVK